jgi:phosphoribosylaminoimidazolecarboxamide formyltransferase/IMP cyclohydrolase
MKITSALISVFDKEGILPIAQELIKNNVTIYSTGGTLKFLQENQIQAVAVDSVTQFPEILDGRVKTLHPYIFGGILFRRDLDKDLKDVATHQIPVIDLVIVDLYPFEDTVSAGKGHDDIIEKIDIGGISLIRATAKNYKFTTIVPSKSHYEIFLNSYRNNNGSTPEEFRKYLAGEAFKISSHYDNEINSYLANNTKSLRYGENPHQKAFFKGNLDEIITQLNGKELSYNNLLDIDASMQLVGDLSKDTIATFAIIKHNNACGCAQRNTVSEAFADALAGDPVSAFGGILITDKMIDMKTATQMNDIFFEVCIAKGYDKDALDLLSKKKNRIILKWNSSNYPKKQVRNILNGILVQERDEKITSSNDLKTVTQKAPNNQEEQDMIFASILVKNTKSNAIVLVKNGQLIGIGTGQTSRVDALRQAVAKAQAFNFDLNGSAMASDAFFPFPDCVTIAAEYGISSVIQPGGSIKDQDSIDACDNLGLSMVTTGIRHFKH